MKDFSAARNVKYNPLVSIVVPVYEVEAYLRRCVESLLGQSYSNIEIILIDDGSLDRSPEICDHYSVEDSRVRVIHRTNGGLSAARNTGLEIANGEYICFVDSDDYVEHDYVSTLLTASIEANADIVACSFWWFYSQENKVRSRADTPQRKYTAVDGLSDIFQIDNGNLNVVAWNKLYKRSLFTENRISYPVGKIHEDNFTTYKLIGFSNTIVFVDKPLYNYVQREGSIVSLPFSLKRLDTLEAYDQAVDWITKNQPSLRDRVELYRINSTFGTLAQLAIWEHRDATEAYVSVRQRLLGYIGSKTTKISGSVSRRMRLEIMILKNGTFSYRFYRRFVLMIKGKSQ